MRERIVCSAGKEAEVQRRDERMKKKPRTGSTVSAFIEAVGRTITPALAALGFTQEQADVEDLSAAYCHGNGPRYVKVSANADPRDSPCYLNAVLGEGQRSWPGG